MNGKLPRVEGQDVVRALKRAGFEERGQRGSHVYLKRDSDNKRVTVPVHKGHIVPIGTLRAILRDAHISIDEFRGLL